MVVERSVEVHEVREESTCRYLTCELIKVVVAVLRKVAYASLLLPDLDWEDSCRAVSYTLICGVEELTDNTTSLGRSVSTIVDRTEHHLVTTT